MILIARTSFPKSSLQAAARAFSQLLKLPSTVKRQGPYFYFDAQGNIHSTALYFFDTQQLSHEHKKFIQNRLKVFSDVGGFSFTIEESMNMEEALLFLKQKK
jgi:hypothetical protein